MLINHLKVILLTLISKEQGASVLDRSITNNILLAQEVMHSIIRTPWSRILMMIRLNIENRWGALTKGAMVLHSARQHSLQH